MKSLLKHKALFHRSLIILSLIASLCACDKRTVYHVSQSLPTEGWQRTDTLFFNIPVTDSTCVYSLSVEIRNRSNYPYQNIPLLLRYDSPEKKNILIDTLRLALADKEGTWKGYGWGGLYQCSSPVKHVSIGKAGEYRFKVSHLLPDEALLGINDIGIKLRR